MFFIRTAMKQPWFIQRCSHGKQHISEGSKIQHWLILSKMLLGKIQRDGRTFLDCFKSYFWSQISSQSLNEVHIYWLQPKSATKGECFFSYIFLFDCHYVSSSQLMLPFDVWPGFPVTMWTLPYADFGKAVVLTTTRSQIAFFSCSFSAVFNCRSLFNEAAYLAALRRLRSPFAIRDADSETIKDKNIWNKSPFVAVSAVSVIGR